MTQSAPTLTPDELARYIDHTTLKPDATVTDLERLCQEAAEHHFAMVAVNSAPVARCAALLNGTGVHVGAAIGFPLGQTTIAAKVFEVADAIENGADEIDYVINITELKAGNLAHVEDEMRRITDEARRGGILSKVILETCYLTDAEKRTVCEIAREVRPDFVKTSTGFGTAGATSADVELMRSVVGDDVQIKAAGGVRTLADALRYIDLGVTRIGTSSGIALLDALR